MPEGIRPLFRAPGTPRGPGGKTPERRGIRGPADRDTPGLQLPPICGKLVQFNISVSVLRAEGESLPVSAWFHPV